MGTGAEDMSTTQQPEALRLAEQYDYGDPVAHSNTWKVAVCTELRRLHAENESLHVERERNLNSIRVCNEIINKKNAELESLTTGYAAARLEIESLQARIKTMAEEHADELMVAHMDGRMRAAEQQAAPKAAPGEPIKRGQWAWLPIEPTTGMLIAGNHGQPGDFSALKVWQDMIAALDRSADQRPKRGNNCHEAAPQQEAQEPGWVLVPAEATDAMMAAFAKAADADVDWHNATESDRQDVRDGFYPAYRAMLRAAPQPLPASQGDALDAARYRWLRATTNYVTSNGERIDVRNSPEKWDAAIDAARTNGDTP